MILTSCVVCTMKCLLTPPQHTLNTISFSVFLVVSRTRKSPSRVNSLTTSSLGNTPWNHSSSPSDRGDDPIYTETTYCLKLYTRTFLIILPPITYSRTSNNQDLINQAIKFISTHRSVKKRELCTLVLIFDCLPRVIATQKIVVDDSKDP